MNSLRHYPLCPLSRQIRVLLKEIGQEVELINEEYWLRSDTLLKLNPAGELPILTIEDGIICGVYSILEYLQETHAILMPSEALVRANVRRMIAWFNYKFYNEVSKHLLNEKLIRFMLRSGAPDTSVLNIVRKNITGHLNYCTRVISANGNLAAEQLSVADIVAASHISVVDYFGEIDWSKYPALKDWYMIIKSRPSFRILLSDYVVGIIPAKHYAVLDF